MKPGSTRKWISIATLGIVALGLSALLTGAYQGENLAKLNPFIESLHGKLEGFNGHLPEERVYLHTDRPQYQPGDDIWFAAYVREGRTLRPSGVSQVVNVQLINPKGTVERELKLITEDGIAAGDFHLDAEMPGGQYKLKASTQYQQNEPGFVAFEKSLTVQKVVMPNLKMKLDFQRKAYGPGDEVAARLSLQTNANQPLANHSFVARPFLKGVALPVVKATTDGIGEAMITFALPQDLTTHDGLLNVVISHEGLSESVSRSIPIVLGTLDMQLMPEGGDLVDGLRSRVAFRAKDEFGKPADVEGIVKDQHGLTVGEFRSFHDGMGAFDFTPVAGGTYTAHVTKPEGNKQSWTLPEALPQGYVLNINGNSKDGIDVVVRGATQEALSLVAQVRGEIYYATELEVKPGETRYTIPTQSFPMGVAQVTLFDSKGIARAERLTFVNRHRQLTISATPDKEKYLPREKVTMTVRVKDEKGMPMPAHLSMAVVDDQLLAFADDKQGNLLSQMLLQQDLSEAVEEPRFYFDPKEEDAPMATEMLLMTSGWRRFTWEQVLTEVRPPLRYTAEKTDIAGYIYDENGQGLKGAKVASPDGKLVTYTDANGHYTLRGVMLYEPVSLKASASGKEATEIYVTAYGEGFDTYLYSPVPHTRWAKGEGRGMVMEEMVLGEANAMEMEAPVMDDVQEREDPGPDPMIETVTETTVAVEKTKAVVAAKPEVQDQVRVQQGPPQRAVELKHDPMDGMAMADSTVVHAAGVKMMEQNKLADKNWDFMGDEEMPQVTYHRARQFAAPQYTASKPASEERTDFRSTVYWNPHVKVDRSGKAVVTFHNTDAISSFRTIVEGFGTDGMPGRSESVFYTQLPFSITSRLPVEVVTGDQMHLPVVLKNNTSSVLRGDLRVNVPQGLESLGGLPGELSLAPGEVRTLFLGFQVQPGACGGEISLRFTGGGHADAVSQTLTIAPKGFPVQLAASGNALQQDLAFEILRLAPRSIHASVVAYPSVLSDLLKGIESILQEPYGCFEQTSSSNYPNVLVMQHLRQQQNPDKGLVEKTKKLLESGYKKLVGFETRDKGYEWFGSNPGHEALTAYGLLEFHDMGKVYDGVDKGMVDRTASWLMSRKDGKGGFRRNPESLDQFGAADEDITNAYITWSLAEAGYKDIRPELTATYAAARKGKDAYLLGLAANAAFASGDKATAAELTALLATAQTKEGKLVSSRHSITRSQGISLEVETTALATMAFLRATKMENANAAAKWLVGQRSGQGGFGSTQGTVLALKALTAYAEANKRAPEGGKIVVKVNGTEVMSKEYKAGEDKPIELLGLEQFITGEGRHSLSVEFVGVKQALPWSINVGYNTVMPQSSPDCVVGLTTSLASASVKMGETVRLNAKVTNRTQKGQPMTMAVLGIPAGLSPQPWQLKELQEKGVIDFYEVKGSTVACYYRQMKPGEVREIALDLKAEIPGQYEAPASRAYLYYTAEHKTWLAGNTITVTQP